MHHGSGSLPQTANARDPSHEHQGLSPDNSAQSCADIKVCMRVYCVRACAGALFVCVCIVLSLSGMYM
jgi:hypothetical protein